MHAAHAIHATASKPQTSRQARHVADRRRPAGEAGARLRVAHQARVDAEAGAVLRHAELEERLRAHTQRA